MLIVSAVKIRKRCLQTVSASGGLSPDPLSLDPTDGFAQTKILSVATDAIHSVHLHSQKHKLNEIHRRNITRAS